MKVTGEQHVACVNHVLLVGNIGRGGVEVRAAPSGAAQAVFPLLLAEQGQDGKIYTTSVPCEIWGRYAEDAGGLGAGQLVLVEGRLKKRPRADTAAWELCVVAFDVTPVLEKAALPLFPGY